MSEYSVAIRTLGRAGEKYQKLLNSIQNSNHPPEKVVVVLPEGYALPKERLGWEEFVFCPKSMVGQRLEALKYIDSEYTLFLDDDISFEPDFVDQLLKPLDAGNYDCSTGPLFSFFPASTMGKIAGTLTASVSISLFRRDMYVKILRSGGWSYHTFDTDVEHYYPTESFAWTCFMIRTQVMRNLRMEDEQVWLERFGYAYGDDRVMAYKLNKLGYKACVVSNALYEHNDAKTSTSVNEMSSAKTTLCTYYMQVVFWHRFIQDIDQSMISRFLSQICFSYWRFMMSLFWLLKCVFSKSTLQFTAFRNGLREGDQYVRSAEYRALAAICNVPNCEVPKI